MMRLPSLIIAVLLAAPAMAEPPISCDSFAHAEASQVLAIFHDGTKSEDQKRSELAVLFKHAIDTDWIGRTVLGRAFRTGTPEQQREYLSTYGQYVAQSYVSRFDNDLADDIQQIRVVSVAPTGEHRYAAAMKIDRKSGEPVDTSFLLDDSDGTCRVHDVIVEGVSLMVSERSEFSSLAAAKGIAGVTAAMKLHLAAP